MKSLNKLFCFTSLLFILVACEASEAELCHGDNCALVRFKAITVLEVDGELKEFYSVLQAKVVRLEEGQSALGFGGRSKLWNEATVIDLGERGQAYTLNYAFTPGVSTNLSSIYPQALLTSFGSNANMGNLKKDDIEILKQTSGRFQFKIPGLKEPTIVYFKNDSNQNSVEYLHTKDFPKHFGEGVKFVGFFIEKTGEDITDGKIQEFLPWLDLKPYKMFEQAPNGIPRSKWKLKWHLSKSAFVMPEHIRKSK